LDVSQGRQNGAVRVLAKGIKIPAHAPAEQNLAKQKSCRLTILLEQKTDQNQTYRILRNDADAFAHSIERDSTDGNVVHQDTPTARRQPKQCRCEHMHKHTLATDFVKQRFRQTEDGRFPSTRAPNNANAFARIDGARKPFKRIREIFCIPQAQVTELNLSSSGPVRGDIDCVGVWMTWAWFGAC
jgi:hypothetical protein